MGLSCSDSLDTPILLAQNVRIHQAWMKEDWKSLSTLTQNNDTFPFLQALALHQLGKSSEVIPILQKLVKTSPILTQRPSLLRSCSEKSMLTQNNKPLP